MNYHSDISKPGNRIPVPRVTGGDAHRYTTKDLWIPTRDVFSPQNQNHATLCISIYLNSREESFKLENRGIDRSCYLSYNSGAPGGAAARGASWVRKYANQENMSGENRSPMQGPLPMIVFFNLNGKRFKFRNLFGHSNDFQQSRAQRKPRKVTSGYC